MDDNKENKKDFSEKPVALVRSLGAGSVILLGVGALLGGGIFTLLGHSIGLAGPAVILSMILASIIAFLNLQVYISLSTTFPEAGGGYLWTKLGLGKMQGFLAGWFSWFAHASACGLYSLSFGYYFYFLLFSILGLPNIWNIPSYVFEKIFAILAVLLFVYINYKGGKTLTRVGNYITVSLLLILLGFIVSGFLRMGSFSDPFNNFKNFAPYGLLGIISAASFFYIAFEGSEIQTQTAEEIKNPRHLKISLLASWAIITTLYILIAFVMVGATVSDGSSVWKFFDSIGEGAIIESAKQFIPFGMILMVIAGILANIAALNATIFSSSHVSFAMARDKIIFEGLSKIHPKFSSPYLSLFFSLILILLMIIFLPLYSVGAVASLLFILLFLQLNIAAIQLYRKRPETKWVYRIPFFPIPPIIAIVIYIILAIAMLKVNLTAWFVVSIWFLLGLVNFFAYAEKKEYEEFEREIVYEKTLRLGEKKNYRILLPLGEDISIEQVESLSKIAFVLAREFNGEIIFVRINEVSEYLPTSEGAKHLSQTKQMFEKIYSWAEEFNQETLDKEKQIAIHTFILVSRSAINSILDIVEKEECDLLILNWKGFSLSKRVIFGSKIDVVLRQSECNLLITKITDEVFDPKSIFLAVDPRGKNPYLNFMGGIINAFYNYFKAKVVIASVVKLRAKEPNFAKILNKMELNPNLEIKPLVLQSESVIKIILSEGQKHDLIILGATRGRFLRSLTVGSIPEAVMKHSSKPVFILKAHRGIMQTFIGYLKDKLF